MPVNEHARYIRYDMSAVATNAALQLLSGVLILLMQLGFLFLEVGSVKIKNTTNILMKNLIDACICGLVWWAFGWAFAYGPGGNAFIASGDYFRIFGDFEFGDETSGILAAGSSWFFNFAFIVNAVTIVSGSVAERIRIEAYFVYAVVMTGLVYPVVAHWAWSASGWASTSNPDVFASAWGGGKVQGVIDFAGSGVVHMTGGLMAIMGSYFLGPRKGRFSAQGHALDVPGQSTTFKVVGTMLLWIGWLAFNPGSATATAAASVTSPDSRLFLSAMFAATNTIIASCTGGITLMLGGLLWAEKNERYWSPVNACNGILSGLVAITSPCAVVEPWAAFVIGLIASIVYAAFSKLMLKLRIDDVVDAGAVHFACGAWGIVAAGLFATKDRWALTYATDETNFSCGAFYSCGRGGYQLAFQICFCLAVTLWVGLCGWVLFKALSALDYLRVDQVAEEVGLDLEVHGSEAYEMGSMGVMSSEDIDMMVDMVTGATEGKKGNDAVVEA